MAERYGVTLCVKAHVGRAIYNTPTTLKVMEGISSPAFGIDMDPSHIYRAGENPVEAIAAVISRVKHVHIRDCKGRQQGPGKPEMQANGRGDIDLVGYVRVLHENGYEGPLDLEIIGAKDYAVDQCIVIAAEARGHMQACLQACGDADQYTLSRMNAGPPLTFQHLRQDASATWLRRRHFRRQLRTPATPKLIPGIGLALPFSPSSAATPAPRAVARRLTSQASTAKLLRR